MDVIEVGRDHEILCYIEVYVISGFVISRDNLYISFCAEGEVHPKISGSVRGAESNG